MNEASTAGQAAAIPRRIPGDWPIVPLRGGPPIEGASTGSVRDPYTREPIAEINLAAALDVYSAVSAASTSPPMPAVARAEVLERAAAIVLTRKEDFARVLAMECGKPLTQARVEVSRCVDTLTFSAIEARTLAGEVVPMEGTWSGVGKIAFVTREPVGIVGAISPFNFPLNLVAHKIGPAVAAGCPIVLKPAPATPLSALGLASVLIEAGLAPDALAVLPGDIEVGEAIVQHSDVPFISFTGSEAVGYAIRDRARGKTVALELGNSTPVLIAADADLKDAAARIARSGFSHAGQSCVSVQRVFVEAAAYEPFIDELAREVSGLVLGDPLDEATDVGPVIDDAAAARILAWIDDAVTEGGRVVAGGGGVGRLISPTVIADLPETSLIAREEVFGPVVGVAPVADMDEGIRRANATRFGLQAGIFTGRVDRAIAMSRSLQFGGIVVNETPTFRADQMPYGGVKASGDTREGPRFTVQAMTVPKLVVIRIGP